MGLFEFFKRDRNNVKSPTDKGIMLGPTFFDGWTEPVKDPKKLLPHEWRGKLKTPSGQTKFKIKFYGKLHEEYPNLIVATEFAPPLVYAVDSSSGKDILLFDGCKHGYNAMFCDKFSVEQMQNRPVENLYRDQDGKDTFEITISTYNQANYDEEFKEKVDENGCIELIDGSKTEFEKAIRNAFDTLFIFAANEDGKVNDILSEELA